LGDKGPPLKGRPRDSSASVERDEGFGHVSHPLEGTASDRVCEGYVAPLRDFLVSVPDAVGEAAEGEGQTGATCGHVTADGETVDPWAAYRLPESVLQGWGQALDIVTPESQRCNCFTKTYSRYTKVGFGHALLHFRSFLVCT
jgi:hypothetical protein